MNQPYADTIISHDIIITSWYFFLFFFFSPLRPIYTSARHFRYLIIVVCTLIAENLEGWSWWRAPQSSEISLFTARTVSALLFFLYSSVQLSPPSPSPRFPPHNRVSWCALSSMCPRDVIKLLSVRQADNYISGTFGSWLIFHYRASMTSRTRITREQYIL